MAMTPMDPVNRDEDDAWLVSLSPRERRAVLTHRYFLGTKLVYPPTPRETRASWDALRPRWLAAKLRKEIDLQVDLIEKRRQAMGRAAGRKVEWEEAIRDWASDPDRAKAWRDAWESREEDI